MTFSLVVQVAIAFGGTGSDNITAGSGNDLVFGDHGKVEGVIDLSALPLN
ncbi:MAG: hypothetical protein KME12_22865 [Trichocoleus desertorum ATA4-8-CV12]|nr:hypothetical protein [Trichocoleus desertorum ATA4-8-CV12]